MNKRVETQWVRWLARSLPPDHIAHVLGCALADVAEALSRPQLCPADVDAVNVGAIGVARKQWVRRLDREGLNATQIARKTGLSRAVVYAILGLSRAPSCPHHRQQGAIKAQTGLKVRKLIELGHSAESIAEVLALDLVKLRAFLARAYPAPKPPREPKPPKPPKPGSRQDPERWRYLDTPPLDQVEPAAVSELLPADGGQAVAGDGPAQACAEVLPPPIADPMGEWSHYQGAFKGRPKLDWNAAESIRRERAEGATRPALARRYNVSLGTIDSVLAGRTYAAPPPVEEIPVPLIETLPARSIEPTPQPHRWREPNGKRSDAWHDD